MTDGTTVETDVCVIGGGPAGLVVARTLAERGRDVVVLESGAAEFDPDADALDDGDTVGDEYAGLRATRARRLGGTTALWNTAVDGAPGAKWVPLDPVDVDGHWPFDHATLAPWYERAQRLCGLGPPAYDASSWALLSCGPLGGGASHIVSRVYQLGARGTLLDPTVASLRASSNATVHTRATVSGLETARRRVTRAHVAAHDGARWSVRAERYVLACGAVENARLLLASGIGSGPVGHCFMEHPRDRAIVVSPDSTRTYRDAAFYDLHTVRGTPIVGRFALTERAVRDLGLNASVTLLPRIRPWVARALALSGPAGRRSAARRWLPAIGTGWSTHPAPSTVYDGFVALLNVEQPPRAENRVVLGTRRDAYGTPLPVLHWRWHAEDHARLRRTRAAVARDLETLGLGRATIDDAAVPDPNAHHHAGTTRMHADPREGVVDADCRVHALDNLWAAGASVFPTAGFANPALTIVALSLRLGEHLSA